jgi:DNA-binding response OmpR family regulator
MTQEHTTGKGTILIIDDDMGLQAVLYTALTKEGYQVVEATDGEQGLTLISKVHPSLVISDIMMPNLDGVELFHHIREHLQDDGIPVIIMTALNRKPWFADLEAEGAVILHKPFEVQELIKMIEVALI